MSNLLSDTPFLPASAPSSSIVDCAHILSPTSLSQLNTQASQVYFKPCVVILPSNFVPKSMAQLSSNIVQQWHIPDDSFLMIINLSGHNLRIVPGPKLQAEGMTETKITQLIATKFGPAVRKAHPSSDLSTVMPDAISDTINGVNEDLGHGQVLAGEASPPGAKTATAHSQCFGAGWLVPTAIALIVILSVLYIGRRRS